MILEAMLGAVQQHIVTAYSSDSDINRSGVEETWSTIRGHTDGTGTNTLDAVASVGAHASTSNRWASIFRARFAMNLAALPTDGVIVAAKLRFLTNTGGMNDLFAEPQDLVLTSAPSTLSTPNYDNFGTTQYARLALADMPAGSTWYEVPLTAAGVSALDSVLPGVWWLGWRVGCDRDNSPPTWSAGDYAGGGCQNAELHVYIAGGGA